MRQDKVRPDFLWRIAGLVVEYDGEYHDDPAQIARDAKRRMTLEMMGFTVVTVKKQQVYDPLAFNGLSEMLARKLGKRLRPLTLKQQFAREELRRELLADDDTAVRAEEYPW